MMHKEFWISLSDEDKWILYCRQEEMKNKDVDYWKKRYYEILEQKKICEKERRKLLRERRILMDESGK